MLFGQERTTTPGTYKVPGARKPTLLYREYGHTDSQHKPVAQGARGTRPGGRREGGGTGAGAGSERIVGHREKRRDRRLVVSISPRLAEDGARRGSSPKSCAVAVPREEEVGHDAAERRRSMGLRWTEGHRPLPVFLTFGRANVGAVFGWVFFGHQIGAALASYLGGVVRVSLGDYTAAFLGARVRAILASLMASSSGASPRLLDPRRPERRELACSSPNHAEWVLPGVRIQHLARSRPRRSDEGAMGWRGRGGLRRRCGPPDSGSPLRDAGSPGGVPRGPLPGDHMGRGLFQLAWAWAPRKPGQRTRV